MKKIKKMLLSIMIALMVIGVVPEGIAGLKVCVEVQAAITVATPKLVSAKASGTSKIQITWKKVSGVSGYRLYRRIDGTSWKTVKTISGSSNVTYTDSKLKPGTRYYYTVKAYKKTGGKTYWSKYDTKGVYAVIKDNVPIEEKIAKLLAKFQSNSLVNPDSFRIEKIYTASYSLPARKYKYKVQCSATSRLGLRGTIYVFITSDFKWCVGYNSLVDVISQKNQKNMGSSFTGKVKALTEKYYDEYY